jgi:predicted ATPase/DNA-binding XRE family transcriptional regulator
MQVEVSFGLWLQKRRKALDLTREELAQQIGCSVSALRKIETDERHPSKQLAELLAHALNIPEDGRSTFIKAAREEVSVDKLQLPHPLPDLNLLKSPKAFSKQIPISSPPLFGRETELATLRQMVADSQCRLITLVGPGGCGKTRLAIELARSPGREFLHGSVFVPLVSINSSDLIVPAIVNALELNLDGLGKSYKELLSYLRDKQIFLVLDNVEHLLDGIWIISEMIQYAPQTTVICTSREQLNLHDEWVFAVRGLSLPQSMDAADFQRSSAVNLFLQRARQVGAGLHLNAADREAIVHICQMIEGMPLAIELSAVWARSLSFQEIALEISKSLDFLSTNMRDIPERHRSLRAVFNHSWERLTREEQNVLMRLSVFQGGFTRELAEQVAQTDLDMLSGLIMKSLLQRTMEERYDLHEAVRQYALVQLEMAKCDQQPRNAHLQAFIRLAETVNPELTLSKRERWLAYLEIEHDNFRAALDWAFASGDAISSLRLTSALWRFWFMHSYFVEGSIFLERALQISDSAHSSTLRASVLNGAGLLAYYQNQFDRAKSRLEECLALSSHLSERDIAYAQLTLAYVVHDQLDFTRAGLLYVEALQRFRRLDDPYGIIRALNGQGVLALDMGGLDTAADLFNECLTLARAYNDRGNQALALTNLGWTAAIRVDERTVAFCQEALMLYHEVGNKLGIAFCLEGIGAGLTIANQPEPAAQLFGAAYALRQAIAALPSGTHASHLESIIQKARDSISASDFAAERSKGEAMSLDVAIEYAIAVRVVPLH